MTHRKVTGTRCAVADACAARIVCQVTRLATACSVPGRAGNGLSRWVNEISVVIGKCRKDHAWPGRVWQWKACQLTADAAF
jgi:hypothetical protein